MNGWRLRAAGAFNLSVTKMLAFIAIASGLLLHVYTVLFKAEGPFSFFLLGVLLWSWLPYLASLAILQRWRNGSAALGASLIALAVDLFAFYTVFIRPQSSTAPLVLLFAPLWNLLFFVPLGALIGWLFSRVLIWVAAPSNNRLRGP